MTTPFAQSGKSVTFTAATSAPTAVQASNYEGTSLSGNYRICNSGTNVVFLGIGRTATEAANNATVLSSTSQQCLPILPGAIEVFMFGLNSYFTGITASGTAVVYVTPGAGI
jgi:uncharacterized membrane protein